MAREVRSASPLAQPSPSPPYPTVSPGRDGEERDRGYGDVPVPVHGRGDQVRRRGGRAAGYEGSTSATSVEARAL